LNGYGGRKILHERRVDHVGMTWARSRRDTKSLTLSSNARLWCIDVLMPTS
jgi:hypothetical protein